MADEHEQWSSQESDQRSSETEHPEAQPNESEQKDLGSAALNHEVVSEDVPVKVTKLIDNVDQAWDMAQASNYDRTIAADNRHAAEVVSNILPNLPDGQARREYVDQDKRSTTYTEWPDGDVDYRVEGTIEDGKSHGYDRWTDRAESHDFRAEQLERWTAKLHEHPVSREYMADHHVEDYSTPEGAYALERRVLKDKALVDQIEGKVGPNNPIADVYYGFSITPDGELSDEFDERAAKPGHWELGGWEQAVEVAGRAYFAVDVPGLADIFDDFRALRPDTAFESDRLNTHPSIHAFMGNEISRSRVSSNQVMKSDTYKDYQRLFETFCNPDTTQATMREHYGNFVKAHHIDYVNAKRDYERLAPILEAINSGEASQAA